MRLGLLILFFCLLLWENYAQQYNFQSYGIEEGLPQSTVYEIFQDSRGYLWFGTDGGGLAKFDGRNFYVYNKNSGLAGNVVREIIEDTEENLWIGTDEGISIFNGYEFTTINSDNGLSNPIVVSLLSDENNITWAGTSGGGLCRIERISKDSFNIISYDIEDRLSNNYIFDIYKDDFERLWIATFGGGINVISFKNDSIINIDYLNTNNILPSDRLFDFEVTDKNVLWVSSYDNGAFSIEVVEDIENLEINIYNTSNYLKDYRVWSIFPGEKIWFATDKSGLNIVSKNGKTNSITTKNGLPKNQVVKVFQDNEGSVWFSVFEEGVFRFMGEHFYHLTEKEGLIFDDINDIHFQKNDEILLASDGGGIYEITDLKQPGNIKKVEWGKRIPVNSFTDIETDLKGGIWLASQMGVFNYNLGEVTFYTENAGLINNRVNCLFNDNDDILWCGTVTGISKIINSKIYNASLGEGLINEVQTIIQDNEGNVWCGTLNGLVKFFENLVTIYDEAEGLNEKKINSLIADDKGNIWIGTFGGGIYIFLKGKNTLKPITLFADDSLLNSNNINSLVFEDENILLAGTDKGLNKIIFNDSFEIDQVIQYDNTNGFSGIETSKNSVSKIDNTIWFGTSNGVTVYNYKTALKSRILPQVHINGLKLNLEEINWKERSQETILWDNLPLNAEFSYKDNHLSISYIGLYYNNPDKVFYKYRLLGLSDKWSSPTKMLEEQYPGLQPGRYTFEVLASNENNQWTEIPAQYSFYIKPPFWRTVWFYISCGIFLIIIIISYIKYRERVLKQEKERLEIIVAERTCEVLAQKKEIEDKNEKITDSIIYAKRIQEALLPTEEVLKNYINDYFILYIPRDIVSGDFYWMTSIDEKLIIVAADCTGHGVPGAFMSMLGISYFNEIVGKNKITDTAEILNMLRKNVIESLKQKSDFGASKDGMDLALCTIDFKTNKLQFSGAHNTLILIRNG
ncbi:two-component regulator propeller domain-containing protein, partial [Bacteroidota bacterium]